MDFINKIIESKVEADEIDKYNKFVNIAFSNNIYDFYISVNLANKTVNNLKELLEAKYSYLLADENNTFKISLDANRVDTLLTIYYRPYNERYNNDDYIKYLVKDILSVINCPDFGTKIVRYYFYNNGEIYEGYTNIENYL